jgi:probable HAF family extracellular repeat protein
MQHYEHVVSSRARRLMIGVAVLGLAQGVLSQAALAQATYRAIPLGSLGTGTYAADINETGEISGSSTLTPPQQHAFLYTTPPGSSQPVMIDLGTLGGRDSNGYGINDSGSVVGTAQTSDGSKHAFVRNKGGAMTDLHPLLGGDLSSATAINNSGNVVGTWRGVDMVSRAFLLVGQTRISLGTLGGQDSFATAINLADQVVGTSDVANGDDHAFLYNRTNGLMTDLGTLGGTTSYATDISDSGFVAGYSALPNSSIRAFRYSQSTGMVNLGTLAGGGPSRGGGVNSAGQVVGWALGSDFTLRAFIYTDGQMWDLNELAEQSLPVGVQLTNGVAINDRGWIVATAENGSSGAEESYLLMPVTN